MFHLLGIRLEGLTNPYERIQMYRASRFSLLLAVVSLCMVSMPNEAMSLPPPEAEDLTVDVLSFPSEGESLITQNFTAVEFDEPVNQAEINTWAWLDPPKGHLAMDARAGPLDVPRAFRATHFVESSNLIYANEGRHLDAGPRRADRRR
jgi:hypothetical protein